MLAGLRHLQLTLVLGQYALAYHLADAPPTVTDAVLQWQSSWPDLLALPHPSPRNVGWFKANPWFADQIVPVLRERVATLVAQRGAR